MNKQELVGIADIEKMNVSELNNVKGGVASTDREPTPSEDSQHHDSDNNDKLIIFNTITLKGM